MKTHPQPGTIDALNLAFKKLIRKAATRDEAEAIRAEWNQSRAAFWETHAADSIEQVDDYYKSLYAHTQTDEERSKVRLAWAESKADFFERLYKGNGSSPSTPAAEQVVEASEDSEAEDRRLAFEQYGAPAAGSYNPARAIYAPDLIPFEIHLPQVEVITTEESK